ncbi:MAG: hypothetical protein GYB31_19045 [Bacteroidetes bacterium]|nr:hypothetical protein [Bacteroidota bacterium]
MTPNTGFILLSAVLILSGCSKNAVEENSQIPQPFQSIEFPGIMSDMEFEPFEIPKSNQQAAMLVSGREMILVNPGIDQLQHLINKATPNTTIVLKEGLHKETGTLVLNKRITLIGEGEATLALGGQIGMFIYRSENVEIKNLEIVNLKGSFIGLAADNSNHLKLEENDFSGFPVSIILERSNYAEVQNNIILGTGNFAEDLGITVTNGSYTHIEGNEIYGNAFGIWVSDAKGVVTNNYTHDNMIGIILCKIPDGSIPFGGGTGGSESPASEWKIVKNVTETNGWGVLLIDGAHNNLLAENTAAHNSFTDIELAGETNQLFGFFTPTSFNNVVYAKGKKLEVINNGKDNSISGSSFKEVPYSK